MVDLGCVKSSYVYQNETGSINGGILSMVIKIIVQQFNSLQYLLIRGSSSLSA